VRDWTYVNSYLAVPIRGLFLLTAELNVSATDEEIFFELE